MTCTWPLASPPRYALRQSQWPASTAAMKVERMAKQRLHPETVEALREVQGSVSLVARRHDMNANQVFTWRRQYRERGGFVPVVVAPDRLLPPPPDAGSGAVPAAGRMEIALADGSRVIVDREVDGEALGRVLSALARR